MRFEYAVVALGTLLSLVAAVVPHYSGAYQMQFGILVVHLLPYLLYWPLAVRPEQPLTRVAGLLLLSAHGWLVLEQRLARDVDDAGVAIYVVPLVLAALLIPLFIRLLRRPLDRAAG